MDTDTLELAGGAAVLVASAVVLFLTLFVGFDLPVLVLVAATLGLAVGALLVGLSRRGPPV